LAMGNFNPSDPSFAATPTPGAQPGNAAYVPGTTGANDQISSGVAYAAGKLPGIVANLGGTSVMPPTTGGIAP
jgi:hypothetical protein